MIYENVARIASEKNLSLNQLEIRANLAKGTVSKWKRVSPNINSLKAVADVLKVKVDKLIN